MGTGPASRPATAAAVYRGGYAYVVSLEATQRTGLHTDARWNPAPPGSFSAIRACVEGRPLRDRQLIISGYTVTIRIHQWGIQRN